MSCRCAKHEKPLEEEEEGMRVDKRCKREESPTRESEDIFMVTRDMVFTFARHVFDPITYKAYMLKALPFNEVELDFILSMDGFLRWAYANRSGDPRLLRHLDAFRVYDEFRDIKEGGAGIQDLGKDYDTFPLVLTDPNHPFEAYLRTLRAIAEQ